MKVMNPRGRPGLWIDPEDFCYGQGFEGPNLTVLSYISCVYGLLSILVK